MREHEPTVYKSPDPPPRYGERQFFVSYAGALPQLWCNACKWFARIGGYPAAPDEAFLRKNHRCGEEVGGWQRS